MITGRTVFCGEEPYKPPTRILIAKNGHYRIVYDPTGMFTKGACFIVGQMMSMVDYGYLAPGTIVSYRQKGKQKRYFQVVYPDDSLWWDWFESDAASEIERGPRGAELKQSRKFHNIGAEVYFRRTGNRAPKS